MTWPAICAASALPPAPAFCRSTATATIGRPSLRAYPMNQPWSGASPFCAVPVLPPTSNPSMRAFLEHWDEVVATLQGMSAENASASTEPPEEADDGDDDDEDEEGGDSEEEEDDDDE